MEKFENLNGKKVKIISTDGGHGVPVGKVVTITASYPGNGGNDTYYHNYNNNNTILYRKNFVLYANTKEDMQNEIEELKNKMNELQSKLNFLSENNLTEFDSDYYKVYTALKELDKDSSITDKAKVITNLIKG
jgi:hypothetical protein